MPGSAIDHEITSFLASCRTASLATLDAAVGPHAANVQYVSDDEWRLYWVSNPASRHSLDLVVDPRAAVTIYDHDDHPEHIHGLQLRGHCSVIVDKAAWDDAWELYTAKFAFIRSMPSLEQAVRQQRFYCFTPTWVRWIDNRRGFGWKVERELAAGERG